MPFDSREPNLSELLQTVAEGKLQLPDFQREWKWEDSRIASLLASVSLGYPVGVAMTLQTGGDAAQFAPRPIEGVAVPTRSEPEELLLDGQQRLTSLYQSLKSGRAVDTKDSRNRLTRRWYYIDIAKALDPNADREEAIASVPEDRVVREDFGRTVKADYTTQEKECRAEMFPLSIVFDVDATDRWMTTYLQLDTEGMQGRLSRWSAFRRTVLSNFTGYDVPMIRLGKDTPKEAVCTVFEKVNTGGVQLNVFELLTATFAASNFRLKDDWEARSLKLRKRHVLRSVENVDFLQTISLLATYARHRHHLDGGGERRDAPAVTCKSKDVLKLTLADYQTWADDARDAYEWAAQFLAHERIFRSEDLPYRTQLVPLAAIRAVLGPSAETYGARAKLRRWYWSGVLGELYGGSIETRFARDLEQVADWVLRGSDEPGTVREASFQAPRLLTLRTRNSAAYKGVYALLMRSDCVDWMKGQSMTVATFFDLATDIHHVFPKAWCDRNGIDHTHRESIVNKTALSYSTNRSIGGRSPSDYLPMVAVKADIDDGALDRIVITHRINPVHLRRADFKSYFDERSEALLALISEAMGKEAVREATTDDGEAGVFPDERDDVASDPEDDLGAAS